MATNSKLIITAQRILLLLIISSQLIEECGPPGGSAALWRRGALTSYFDTLFSQYWKQRERLRELFYLPFLFQGNLLALIGAFVISQWHYEGSNSLWNDERWTRLEEHRYPKTCHTFGFLQRIQLVDVILVPSKVRLTFVAISSEYFPASSIVCALSCDPICIQRFIQKDIVQVASLPGLGAGAALIIVLIISTTNQQCKHNIQRAANSLAQEHHTSQLSIFSTSVKNCVIFQQKLSQLYLVFSLSTVSAIAFTLSVLFPWHVCAPLTILHCPVEKTDFSELWGTRQSKLCEFIIIQVGWFWWTTFGGNCLTVGNFFGGKFMWKCHVWYPWHVCFSKI